MNINKIKNDTVITRFAPSPTGNLHIGNIRIAIYSWIFSKINNGKFILRIDDTNNNKIKKKFIKSIIKDLKWIGIKYDKLIIQSNNIKFYNKILNNMLESNIVYPCFCSKKRIEKLKINQKINNKKQKYDNFCRYKNFSIKDLKKKHVIRFKNPINTYTKFNDYIYGNITFNNNELDDFIIRKEDKSYTYNFCSVFDDINSNITHIIRGDDHISNTPKQINILKSIGEYIPKYIHIPIMLDKKKNKLSKRIKSYNIKNIRNKGILSESIIHYVISVGNSYFDKYYNLILNKNDIIKNFNIKKINKSPIIFDNKRLLNINKNYIINNKNNKSFKKFKKFIIINNKKKIFNNNNLYTVFDFFKNRSKNFMDIINNLKFINKKKISKTNINIIKKKVNLFKIINYIIYNIKKINVWSLNNIKNILNFLKNNKEKNNIYNILNIILYRKKKSPEISYIMFFLGKEETIKRLNIINNMNDHHEYD